MTGGPGITARRLVFGTGVLVATVALLWPRVTVELPNPGLPWDKAVHLLLFGGLAVLGSWARLPALPLAGILAVQAVLTEAVQGLLLPQRSADVADLVVNGIGIALGILVGRLVAPVSRR